MTETFFAGNSFFPFNHHELYQEHPESYELIVRIWGAQIKPPVQAGSGEPSILDLRILATLMAQRGRDHGLSGGKGSTVHVHMLIARHLLEHLPPGPR